MPLRNWKSVEPWFPDDDLEFDEGEFLTEEDVDEIFYETNNRRSMKNIFINSKIKKQKFNNDIVSKIKFGNINTIMSSEDGQEAYLGAYSEMEFFAYRFHKVHKFHPDVLTIRHLKPEKFIEQIFTYCKVPRDSYYKAYQDERGKISLNSSFFAFDIGSDDQLYMYIDSDEVVFYYNSDYEKDENSTLYLLISLLKTYIEPKITKNKIFVVYQGQSGFEKTAFDVKKINVDLDSNYNDGFSEVSEKIITGLNDKKKTNLVILQGAPGTGKCVIGKTKITVRNKKTGIIEDISIEDLM
jgi:hypothetical protein